MSALVVDAILADLLAPDFAADLRYPSTIPAPPPVKTCSCGREYSQDEWDALAYVGVMNYGFGKVLELRNCQCRSTIGIELATVSP